MKSSRRKIFFNNCALYVSKDVYEPAEDTFLLAENLTVNEDDVVSLTWALVAAYLGF